MVGCNVMPRCRVEFSVGVSGMREEFLSGLVVALLCDFTKVNEIQHLICLFFFFLTMPVECGILVFQPGIEPASPALEAWSPFKKLINFFLSGCAGLRCFCMGFL